MAKPKPSDTTISRVMAYLGSQTSKSKRAASRQNGKKGGRPPLKKLVDRSQPLG